MGAGASSRISKDQETIHTNTHIDIFTDRQIDIKAQSYALKQ